MIYRVRARFRTETAPSFLTKLADGTVERQIPDGHEIAGSMRRAVLNDAGEIEWSELCFCPSPLEHERATVLDDHFDNITTEVISSQQRYKGVPFMEYLKQLADAGSSYEERHQ